MIKKLLQNKILLSIIAVSFLIIGTLFIYIPKVTEQNTIDTVIRNSENAVAQIKLTRAYYVDSVVGDIKKYAPDITFDYDHQGINGKLPFPTSTIHDLSKIFSDNTGVKFKLYSDFPFKPKSSRVLTKLEKEALAFTQKDESGMWVKRDTVDGHPVLRVAVTDYMTAPGCVSCHNKHSDRTWEEGHWKLGDKRGVLEVITPLTKDLEANNLMRDKILIFIAGAMLLLVIYYSISLIRRETELLNANELLDARVKIEVEKNIQQEKQMTQQSRSAAMGDMMGAIIHQWKQPLNGISIANSAVDLQIMLDDFDKEILTTHTQSINLQIENMNQTMNDFRNFFKQQPKSCYEVAICIESVEKLVGVVFKTNNVHLNIELEEGLITEGYPNELNQVIINILNNARDIIEETKCQIREVFVKVFKEDGQVVITITDCAGGVPDELIDKIFLPYVTTKSEDKGTGIGLDMSKTIIEKVNGKLTVQNTTTIIDDTKHKGAMFKIELNCCN